MGLRPGYLARRRIRAAGSVADQGLSWLADLLPVMAVPPQNLSMLYFSIF
jgi:hypothetical protein